MREIFLEGFHRVKAVLAQGEGAGRGGRPCVHQRHLDHVEALFCIAYERTPIGDVDVNLRTLVKVIRIIGVPVAHDGVGNDGIDFDSGHIGTAIRHRPQHIHTSARTDDRVFTMWPQNVDQGRRGGHQVLLPGCVLPIFGV